MLPAPRDGARPRGLPCDLPRTVVGLPRPLRTPRPRPRAPVLPRPRPRPGTSPCPKIYMSSKT